jgi:putative flippase GtrA
VTAARDVSPSSRPSAGGRRLLGQALRFGIAGVLSNALLYAGFVTLLAAAVNHHVAMTMMYLCGIALSFALNRGWTFHSDAPWRPALMRHTTIYVVGYLLNLAGLALLVDRADMPAALAQAAMIAVVAVYLFAAQRHWVFRR